MHQPRSPVATDGAPPRGAGPPMAWAWAALVAALLPIAVATVRALGRGWLPIGDNAIFAIRARDVLSSHPPLLGTWTSASLSTGGAVNNPGPLLFDLLAVPTAMADGGIAGGVALLNGLAVVGIVLFAARRGGVLAAAGAAAAAAALGWAMGSELLFDPWQPHSLLLPFLFLLVLVWSTTCGDLVALPLAFAVGSFVVQTHLTYAVLVPVLIAWAAVGLVLELRRRRRRHPGSWPALRRRVLRAVVVTAVVLAACWAQPVFEQLTSDGDGNLTRLARSLRDPPEQIIGAGLGVRLLTSVTTLPPWWFRSSFGDAFLPPGSARSAGYVQPGEADVPSASLALASLGALAVVLGACAWDAHRRRHRGDLRLLATAAVGMAGGLLTSVRAPVGVFGIAPHQLRWLWPLSAFVFLAVAVSVSHGLAHRRLPLIGPVAAFSALAVVVALLNLPTDNQRVGPSTDDWAIAPMRELGEEMGVLEDEGPLLFDVSEIRFADPYPAAIMAELQNRDIAFVVDDEVWERQLGPHRRFTGDNATAVLLHRVGAAALTAPAGARQVVLQEGIDAGERAELQALRERISGWLAEDEGGGSLRLNGRGRLAVEGGGFSTLGRLAAGEDVDPAALFLSRELVGAVRADLLVADAPWAGRLERYADLQRRLDQETVGLFLRPL